MAKGKQRDGEGDQESDAGSSGDCLKAQSSEIRRVGGPGQSICKDTLTGSTNCWAELLCSTLNCAGTRY